MENKVTVEFSLSQKAFHRGTLNQLLLNNLENTKERRQTDYVLIGVFDTVEQSYVFISENEKRMKDYGIFRSFNGETIVL